MSRRASGEVQGRLAKELKARSLRMTQARRAVLEVMLREQTHLSPSQIFERARRLYSSLGLVTVYRTIDLLEQLGLVQRVHTGLGCRSYARARRGHSHSLICRDCGRVEEFSECALDGTLRALEQKTGFTVERHWLELVGRCPACQLVGSA
jgi:Fur family ferric uptake transcriptional regulator